MTEIVTRGRMRATQLRPGLLIRKPKPHSGFNVCEWTRIAHISREGSDVVLYGLDGAPVDTWKPLAGEERPYGWSANCSFEIGQLADDDAEQAARTAAISPAARGWQKPGEQAEDRTPYRATVHQIPDGWTWTCDECPAKSIVLHDDDERCEDEVIDHVQAAHGPRVVIKPIPFYADGPDINDLS